MTAAAGHVGEGNPRTGKPGQLVSWVTINGGKFTMGTDDGSSNEQPVHEVTIETLKISKTLVTVEQYKQCVGQGRCSKPAENTTQGLCDMAGNVRGG